MGKYGKCCCKVDGFDIHGKPVVKPCPNPPVYRIYDGIGNLVCWCAFHVTKDWIFDLNENAWRRKEPKSKKADSMYEPKGKINTLEME